MGREGGGGGGGGARWEKGENAGNCQFLLFPQCFQKASCQRSLLSIVL